MKRFLGIPIPILSALLAIILIGGGALAAILVTKTVPATVNVIATYNLGVYSDAGCTTPVTTLDFGSVSMKGGTSTREVYVKNLSDVAVTVKASTDLASSKGSLTFTADSTNLISPGKLAGANYVLDTTIVLTLLANSQGALPFNITFTGE